MEFQSFKIILDFKKVYMRRLFWLSKYPVSLTRLGYMRKLYAPLHDKTNKVACAPSEDSVWSESSLSAWRKPGS